MEIITEIEELSRRVIAWRRTGARVGLIATSGALHPGHMTLVRAARERGERIVVSLFCNPADLAMIDDAEDRPSVRDADLAILREHEVDIGFAPTPSEMYPPGYSTRILVRRYEHVLCAAKQPDFFDRQAQVVVKMLNVTRPDTAYFGEKDWQQLLLVRSLTVDLNMWVEVHGCPTAREGDGLAMSTRNRALDETERRAAPRLYAEISTAVSRIARGDPTELACAEAADALIMAGFREVEYLECRNAETLRIAPSPGTGARVFGAAWLGDTRLIDNAPVPDPRSRS